MMEIMQKTHYPVMNLIDEMDYEHQMQTIVEPKLADIRLSGMVSEKRQIYYELYPRENSKGTIVISHGYSECCEKYHELIYYFWNEGYQVAMVDHRGHGRSVHEVENTSLIHIKYFEQYVSDLHAFVHSVVLKKMKVDPASLYLFGHSMGGCIATRYIERYPEDFSKVVLNAPMLGMNLGKMPTWCGSVLCWYHILTGRGKDKIFNQEEFNPEARKEDSCSDSWERYHYFHKFRLTDVCFQTSCSSYFWGKEAIRAGKKAISKKEVAKIQSDVLMIVAGKDTLVDLDAQQTFLKRMPRAKAVCMPGSRHETYRACNAELIDYLGTVFEFYHT